MKQNLININKKNNLNKDNLQEKKIVKLLIKSIEYMKKVGKQYKKDIVKVVSELLFELVCCIIFAIFASVLLSLVLEYLTQNSYLKMLNPIK